LPDYRGVGISSWVLINEEPKTGITLHKIDSGIDTGKVIEIREILISEQDTAYTLFERTEHLILKMFKNWYIDLLEENYTAVSQKKNDKIYLKKDLQKAKNLTKFVKAFYFPGKESAYYYNRKLEKVYLKF
jgi:methionyl-tRNA formyltransferase